MSDKLILEIMKEFDIPFSQTTIRHIDVIISFGSTRFHSVEEFRVLVDYLKERDKKDIYGYSEDDPRFTGVMATDGWLFYLGHYAYYIRNIITEGGMNWLKMDKYLFPTDVYDIVYKHQNNLNKIFYRYMEEEHPESEAQMEKYHLAIKEL